MQWKSPITTLNATRRCAIILNNQHRKKQWQSLRFMFLELFLWLFVVLPPRPPLSPRAPFKWFIYVCWPELSWKGSANLCCKRLFCSVCCETCTCAVHDGTSRESFLQVAEFHFPRFPSPGYTMCISITFLMTHPQTRAFKFIIFTAGKVFAPAKQQRNAQHKNISGEF